MEVEQIKQFHNGLIKCPFIAVRTFMPDIWPLIQTSPISTDDYGRYVVDVKVHMLMPGQFPCIPNWHGDAIPRDADGQLLMDECDDRQRMYLWLSGPPLTEFQDGREIKPRTWIEFGQRDIHRGSVSQEFTWRLFIRLMPTALVQRPRLGSKSVRRHSQVYLDAAKFTW